MGMKYSDDIENFIPIAMSGSTWPASKRVAAYCYTGQLLTIILYCVVFIKNKFKAPALYKRLR